MDRITLIDKNKEFLTEFAAPSITTGRFVACVIGEEEATLRDAFTNPGKMLVHNVECLYEDKTYTGYGTIRRMTKNGDNWTIVLNKEAST